MKQSKDSLYYHITGLISKWECPKCGSFNPVTENKCQDCGYKTKRNTK